MNRLCDRYCDQLVAHAGKRISQDHRTIVDEEDVVQSVLDKFCRGAKEGRFENVKNRKELWRLLVKITVNKIIDLHRRHGPKDGKPQEFAESNLQGECSTQGFSLDNVTLSQFEPHLMAELREQFDFLLDKLRNEEFHQIAVLKLHGASNGEIAKVVKRSRRSVERKLQIIREKWTIELRRAN